MTMMIVRIYNSIMDGWMDGWMEGGRERKKDRKDGWMERKEAWTGQSLSVILQGAGLDAHRGEVHTLRFD